MKSINIKDIKEITLLSKEEADKVDNEILVVNDNWWLRSYGTFGCVYAIDYTGCNDSIYHPSSCSVYVRPALRINNIQSYNLKKYEEVECLGKTWIAIGVDDLILMKNPLFPHRFDNENGNFEESEIKQIINDWLLGRLKEQKSEHNDIVDALQCTVRDLNTIENLDELLKKMHTTPYNEPKIEPLRNDRFREFADGNNRQSIDAKEVSSIEYNWDAKEVIVYDNGQNIYSCAFGKWGTHEDAEKFYNDLVEWRNYWKQN